MKDYDLEFSYHSRKSNVVVDALSRKFAALVAQLIVKEWSY